MRTFSIFSFMSVSHPINRINDNTVPYVTSAIEVDDPFAAHETNGIEV